MSEVQPSLESEADTPATLAARKALFIGEVFRTICVFATNDALASFARSCKTFQEPALRVLWSELSDLRPLIGCLPEYAITSDDNKIVSYGKYDLGCIHADVLCGQQFSHTLRTEDWQTFIKYASYVRSLGIRGPGLPPTLTSGAFQSICALRPTLVLLPNVRQLIYYSVALDDVCLPYLLSIVGTELRVFELHHPMGEAASGAISTGLALLSAQPHLREFKMVGQRPPTISPALSSFLCCVSSLSVLHVESVPVTVEALTHIAAMASLKTVYFYLPDTIPWTSQKPTSPFFPNVESLGIGGTIRSYRAFAKLMPLPHVREFTLALTTLPAAGEPLSTLFSYIRRQFDPKTLKALTIEPANIIAALEQVHNAMISRVIVEPGDLRPIYELTALERVTIVPPWAFALGNDMAHDMAKAWPRMQVLRVACAQWCCPGIEQLRLQMDALAYFAAYCPDLQMLAIPFDAASWVYAPDPPQFSVRHTTVPERFYAPLEGRRSACKLEQLWVNIVPIAGPAPVALYLSRLFPQLKGTCGWDMWQPMTAAPNEEYEEYDALWKEVETILPVIMAARDDGRRIEREEAAGAGKIVRSI